MQRYQVDNLIAVVSSFTIVAIVTILVLRAWRRAFDAKHELRRQFIEKLSAEDIARMLETRSITAIIGGEEESGTAGAMGRGATLIAIGLALGVASAVASLRGAGVAGLVCVAAGIGQMITAWLVARELRRKQQ